MTQRIGDKSYSKLSIFASYYVKNNQNYLEVNNLQCVVDYYVIISLSDKKGNVDSDKFTQNITLNIMQLCFR